MSAEAMATLYLELDDDDARRRSIAAGDFGDADLDDAERDMIRRAAAEELPEVIPFSADLVMPNRFAALDYIGKNLTSPVAEASWLAQFNSRQLAHIAPGK